MKVNSASCWLLLYRYITMHSQHNIKLITILSRGCYRTRFWAIWIWWGM